MEITHDTTLAAENLQGNEAGWRLACILYELTEHLDPTYYRGWDSLSKNAKGFHRGIILGLSSFSDLWHKVIGQEASPQSHSR